MIPVKYIDPDDIALYAMQLLPPDETEEMTLHLQHSAEARRILAEEYSALSIFAHSAEMQSPPAMARQRLMKHVAREKKEVPVDPLAHIDAQRAAVLPFEEKVATRGAAAKILPWVGWALAAGVGGFSALQYTQQERLKSTLAINQAELKQTQAQAELANTLMENVKDSSAAQFTLTATGVKPPPTARVSYVSDKGSLLLVAGNLEKLEPSKVYELWLFPADDSHPIPAGTFKADDRGFATMVLPELPKGIAARNFAVTVEDGLVAVPTTKPVLVGSAG
jgi:hypothetical protein